MLTIVILTAILFVYILFVIINHNKNNDSITPKQYSINNATSDAIQFNEDQSDDRLAALTKKAKELTDHLMEIKTRVYVLVTQAKDILFSESENKNKVSLEIFLKECDTQLPLLESLSNTYTDLIWQFTLIEDLKEKVNQYINSNNLSKEQINQAKALILELSNLCIDKAKYIERQDFFFRFYQERNNKFIRNIDFGISDINNNIDQIYKNNDKMVNVEKYITEPNFNIDNIIDKVVSDLCISINNKTNVSKDNKNNWLEIWTHDPSYILDFCKTITRRIYDGRVVIELLIKKSELLNNKYYLADANSTDSAELKIEILTTLQKSLAVLDNLKKINAIGLEMNERVYDFTNYWWSDDDSDLELMDMVNELYDINQLVIKYVPETKNKILSKMDEIKFMDSIDRYLHSPVKYSHNFKQSLH